MTSPSRELQNDLQGKHPDITSAQPKATTGSEDQSDDNIYQFLESQPVEEIEGELEKELGLTTDDANPTKTDVQALKTELDEQPQESKRVRTFRFNTRFSTFRRPKVKTTYEDPEKIGTYGL